MMNMNGLGGGGVGGCDLVETLFEAVCWLS